MFDSAYLRRRISLYATLVLCFFAGVLASGFGDFLLSSSEPTRDERLIEIGDYDGLELEADSTHVTAS